MRRGEVWWAALPDPAGSAPGLRRPVVVVQSNPFNESRISTVIVAAVTGNLALAEAPGNVRLAAGESQLPRPSVVNVSQLLTVDRNSLTERVGSLAQSTLRSVDEGLRLVLALA